jgi:tryptophan 2,3-dioxygenase
VAAVDEQDLGPVLEGEGPTDYARYMRTETLLSLQRGEAERIHRDELLFQTVHQSTEIWLKLAGAELGEATSAVRGGALETAVRLLARAAVAVELITGQLEMLRHLAPWDFQLFRSALGRGSGFESPGWQGVREGSRELDRAFSRLLADRGIDLADLYRGGQGDPVYRLAEAMIEWDEQIALWRTRHYKVAVRVIGNGVVGTKGTPVDTLVRLIDHTFFPDLWRVRSELTRLGPAGGAYGASAAD